MAIAATTGSAANSAVNVASLALPSVTPTTGRDVVVVVALGSTSSSVSSISTSAGSYTSWTLRASKNGTGVRVEIWTAHVTTGAATVFTVNITGGNTTVAAAVEEYSGVSAFGNTGTSSGTDGNMYQKVTTQQTADFVVAALGFVSGAANTLGAKLGTSRQSSIGANAVGVGLYDDTQTVDGSVAVYSQVSTAQNWASAAVELESGGAAVVALDYGDLSGAWSSVTAYVVGNTVLVSGVTYRCILNNTNHTPPNATYWVQQDVPNTQVDRDVRYLNVLEPLFPGGGSGVLDPVPVGQVLQGGTTGTAYSETISVVDGTAPFTFSISAGSLPTSLSLNSSTGVISGTPTVAGTYNFTVKVVDAHSLIGTQAFTIIIAAPAGAGGAFTFIN